MVASARVSRRYESVLQVPILIALPALFPFVVSFPCTNRSR